MAFEPRQWKRRPNNDSRLHYVLLCGEGVDTQPLSPFRGHHLVDLCTADFQFITSHLPTDVRDLLDPPERRLMLRALGRRTTCIWSLRMDEAATFIDKADPQFLILHFPAPLSKHIDALERRLGWPVLRVAATSHMGYAQLIPPGAFSPSPRQRVTDYVKNVCRLIQAKDPKNAILALFEGDAERLRWRTSDDNSPPCHWHHATYPNDALLSVAGIDVTLQVEPERNATDDTVYKWIAGQAAGILDQRRSASENCGIQSDALNDLILFFPHYFLELFLDDKKLQTWIQSRFKREKKLLRLLEKDLLRRARGELPNLGKDPFSRETLHRFADLLYYQRTFLFSVPLINAYPTLVKSDEGRDYLNLMTAEVAASTAAASLLAANNAAPVLRYSPGLRDSFDALFEFVDLYRDTEADQAMPPSLVLAPPSRHPRQDQIADAFNKFVLAVEVQTPAAYTDLIRKYGAIKIISDFPFEWVRDRTLPLAYSKEFSRIPHTPGRTMMELIRQPARSIHLKLKDVESIRVITSFGQRDSLAGAFCEHLRFCFSSLAPIKIEEIAVRSPKEFIDALTSTPGKIVIIDMHGGMKRDMVGALSLKGNLFFSNLFSSVEFEYELQRAMQKAKRFMHIPPIIIFSACETLSPRANGFSMASALLQAGALAMIATLLPIDADRSAQFIGKVLVEAYGFLSRPLGVEITWRNLVWDQFCCSAALDWLGACQQSFRYRFDDLEHYQTALCHATRSRIGPIGAAESRLVQSLAEVFGQNDEQVRDTIVSQAPFVDTMNYIQLGFPERITLKSPTAGTNLDLPTEIDLFDLALLQRRSQDEY